MSNVVSVTRECVGVQCCKCYEGVGGCPMLQALRGSGWVSNVVSVTREWVGVQCCKHYEGVGGCPML